MSDRDGLVVMLYTGKEHELSATMDEAGAVLGSRPRKEVSVPVVRLDMLISAGTIRPPGLIKVTSKVTRQPSCGA